MGVALLDLVMSDRLALGKEVRKAPASWGPSLGGSSILDCDFHSDGDEGSVDCRILETVQCEEDIP